MPARRWFEFYSQMFDTVELNNTFYRLPSEQTFEAWAAAAPAGFVYAMKLGQFCTHRKKLLDPETWFPKHLDRACLLGRTLGPTLIQLPPRWKRNAARLDEVLEIAPRSMRWAVEVRDPTWLHDDVFDVLKRHSAALCIHDLIENHPFILTTDWTYVRFHGPDALNARYQGEYGEQRLVAWADRLEPVLADVGDVYGYFNNDYHGFAPRDARCLRELLRHRAGHTA
jgi:uncharacterized protein YecE (DUF72 family)